MDKVNFDFSEFEKDAQITVDAINTRVDNAKGTIAGTFIANDTNVVDAKESLLERIKTLKLDTTIEVFAPPIAIKMADTIIGTLGNFSMIQGKAKAKKTFFISMLVASFLTNDKIADTFEGTLPARRKVLYFDTEQSDYHLKKVQERIFRLAQLNPLSNTEKIDFFRLRAEDFRSRIAIIELLISTGMYAIVVIDGIRDLVSDINNPDEATTIATNLLKWTQLHNCHIITVLHENKNDKNARGHLGTELVNKCETNLSVTKDVSNKEVSIVDAEYCRGQDPATFYFTVDAEDLPISTHQPIKESKNVKGFVACEMPIEDLQKLFDLVFLGKYKGIMYAELQISTQTNYNKLFKTTLGKNKVVELITHAKMSGVIKHPAERKPYFLTAKTEHQTD